MPDNRQTRALAKLEQLKRMQALMERRRALEAQGQVASVSAKIGAIDQRVAEEVAAFRDYADTPALGRWAGLMDGRRQVLEGEREHAQRAADALAQKAAEADLTAEQHQELLKHLRKKLAQEQRRAAARAEWEAASQLFGMPTEEP